MLKQWHRRAASHRCAHSLATDWTTTIGIETHVQLKSRAKLFSKATTPGPSDSPNSLITPFDIALPGTLPVSPSNDDFVQPLSQDQLLNLSAVSLGIRAALALGAECQPVSTFDRKHYFYADLPAGYQITQRYYPYALNGKVYLSNNQPIRIQRIQFEQDTAKTTSKDSTLDLDFNRAGCGLLEVVTEPDLRSSDEAVEYVKLLQRRLRAVGVTDGNMEDGSLRCDVNVSVSRNGDSFGTRCEVKNLNSLKSIAQAIRCEALRHIEILSNNGVVIQETRGFDQERVETFTLRTKEDAPDYRYMPDPNIPPLRITEGQIAKVKALLPELPHQTSNRLRSLGLTEREIEVLLNADAVKAINCDGERNFGAVSYFDEASLGRDPKTVANWITNEVLGQLSHRNLSFDCNPVSARQLGGIIDLLVQDALNSTSAKVLLRHMMDHPSHQDAIDVAKQIGTLSGSPVVIEDICSRAISMMPSEAKAVRSGNFGPVNRLVAHVMRETKGKANAIQVREELLKQLSD